VGLFPLLVGRGVSIAQDRREESAERETDEGADDVAPGWRTEEHADGVVEAIRFHWADSLPTRASGDVLHRSSRGAHPKTAYACLAARASVKIAYSDCLFRGQAIDFGRAPWTHR
jgi:hypothetical protein